MKLNIKLFIGAFISFLIITSSIMYSLSILKEEAVNNYLTISKLNAKSFSKGLNQDINNIEQTITNINSLFDLNNIDINKRLEDIQINYPQIRSLNILKNEKIVYSSNIYNIGVIINRQNFFPKTLFDENILKVSTPWTGRDFISGNDIYNYEDDFEFIDKSFIPISKNIKTKKGNYTIIINLNSDYFINSFITSIDSSSVIFELVRLDGILLLSSDNTKSIGKRIKEIDILNKTIEKNIYTDIKNIDGIKYILTSTLTEDYPIGILVKLDYDKSLLSWNKKQYSFFIIIITILVISILITLILFFLYNKKREDEIKTHKLQIQEQEKFKFLFQDSHFLAAVLDSTGKIFDINNLASTFLGKKDTQLRGRYFWDLDCWIDDSRNSIKLFIKNIDETKIETEVVAFDQNKHEKIIEVTISSLDTENGKIIVVIGFDITERKSREKRLKQAYTVFNNTRDGIMITDKETRLIDVNKSFEKITGYKKEEVIGKKTKILRSSSNDEVFYNKMWKKINKYGYWEGEIVNKNKNEKEFTEWLTINAIFDKDKEVLNYIGVFSDITEQKIKEKLLKEKDNVLYQQSKMAAMGEMIGNIAHQWRQPLSVISTAATGMVLKKNMGISDEKDDIESLLFINESCQYLSKTIDDFRNFLKADKDIKKFNIHSAIEDSLTLSSIKVKSQEINIVLNLEELDVYGVKNEFIQVLINILNNAKDAFELLNIKNKLLLIDVFKEDEYVYIKIQDNAGGVPANIIDRVFEPYFTTKHQSKGTGIGLYMCEEIIKNHMKGELSVKNIEFEYDNQQYLGACFIIKVPNNK
ncbi:PAS domain-containing sensor histidine kinase [Halarcobacter sp.]|uniref:sensor histidine kinase n=1 Tax=Halarcobacter sp. TaxID=2321133 RepID=UPI0029F49B60|nr:PAS domain-containing sensor histidine kinase [Halarcobacter sp.]